jgi:hypothetical protein
VVFSLVKRKKLIQYNLSINPDRGIGVRDLLQKLIPLIARKVLDSASCLRMERVALPQD